MKKAVVRKTRKTVGRVTAHQNRAMNVKMLGGEPEFKNNKIPSKVDLITTYSWYSRMIDNEQAKQWLLDYVEKNRPELVPTVRALNEKTMTWTMAWIARLKMRDISFPDSTPEEKFEQYLNGLPVLVHKADEVEVQNSTPRNRLSEFLPDFEEAVDKLDPDFNTYEYLTSRNVPMVYAQRIADYYQDQLDEIKSALDKSCKQCVEAYSHMKKTQLAFFAKYLLNIIDDCVRYIGNNKKERKPRKTKAKKPEQILKHFQYKERDDTLKLISSDPQNILGATQLFALNTSYNVLTIHVAKEGGFGVHRTSITNFDAAASKAKRVGKKLQPVIDAILQGNKKQRENCLNLVSTDFIAVNGRINKDTILLKVIR